MTKPSWQDFGTHDESAYPELWDGVVGAWAPCLGPTGSRLHDMSRRSNWGTLTNMDNATDWVVSNGQYALRFDGTAKRVAMLDLPSNVFSLGFTMSCWVRNLTTPNFDGSPFSHGETMIWINGGKAIAYWNGIRATSATTVTSVASWAMLTIRWTGSVAEVYYNGRIDGSNATAIAPVSVPNIFFIGMYAVSPLRNVAGDIDDCAIWNRALSPNQIRQLCQLGRGGMYQRRRRSRIYIPQAGFQAAWARRQSQIIGGGL